MPSIIRAAIATSVLAAAVFVNPSRVSADDSKVTPAFQQIINKVLEEGAPLSVKGRMATQIGVEESVARFEEVFEGSNNRGCVVVYTSDETGKSRPLCLLITTGTREPSKKVSRWYRFSLDGVMEKAFSMESLYEGDKPVRGSAVFTDLDAKAADVASKAKSELAFWIKRYNSKTAKASAGGKTPATKASPSSSK